MRTRRRMKPTRTVARNARLPRGFGFEARAPRHGAVPGLCHEKEDLTHFQLNCKTEQHAHIKEKASQLTNETMHPACRDVMLAQKKDTQLLDWERNNRTIEKTAVAASEKSQSRVEDARDKNYGSKMSAANPAEKLGRYLCESRLLVWTDGSCLVPR